MVRKMLKLALILIVCGVYGSVTGEIQQVPCQLREYKKGEFVCVCNETYCDSLNIAKPRNFGEYLLISTTESGQRFRVNKGDASSNHMQEPPNVIRIQRMLSEQLNVNYDQKTHIIDLKINLNQKYQEIVGFGGAFTGSVSHLLGRMPQQLRHKLYTSYYSQSNGIGYTMMRMPIGGCDFDIEPWAYNETPENDMELSNFSRLDERDLQRIEQLNELKEVTQNADIKLIGAAWSPPPWMKTNNKWSGASSLKAEYYQTWADYHIRFLELMAEQNVTFWGISTGNEPLNGVIGWFFVHFMSLGWSPENQGKWVANNFGPALRNSAFKDIKLFAGDDQRYTFPWWFARMNASAPEALDFIDGFAVHWYWDKLFPVTFLDDAHQQFPNKIILATEASSGDKPFETHKPILGSWQRAEDYMHSIIDDLQHSVSGWIDWNLLLDENGGPNYVNNGVDAAIVVNVTTYNEFYRQPIFYVMGHFSKFVPSGAVRVEAQLSGSDRKVRTVAFLCPDDTIAVILMNDSKESKLIHYTDDVRGSYEFQIEPKSINTFVLA